MYILSNVPFKGYSVDYLSRGNLIQNLCMLGELASVLQTKNYN